jgi:hypothetical protein
MLGYWLFVCTKSRFHSNKVRARIVPQKSLRNDPFYFTVSISGTISPLLKDQNRTWRLRERLSSNESTDSRQLSSALPCFQGGVGYCVCCSIWVSPIPVSWWELGTRNSYVAQLALRRSFQHEHSTAYILGKLCLRHIHWRQCVGRRVSRKLGGCRHICTGQLQHM